MLARYVRAMREAGLFVTAGTEHNTLDLLPIEPTCLDGAPIPDDDSGDLLGRRVRRRRAPVSHAAWARRLRGRRRAARIPRYRFRGEHRIAAISRTGRAAVSIANITGGGTHSAVGSETRMRRIGYTTLKFRGGAQRR